MFSWKTPRALLAAVLALLRPPQRRLLHPALHRLLHLLQGARTARAVSDLLTVAVHLQLEPAEMEQVRAEAVLALARVPSGSASPKSSRSKNRTARSTTKPRRPR